MDQMTSTKRFPIVLSDELGVGRVQICNEECIHLSVGPVTLNLSPMAFAETAELIRNAMEELSKLRTSGQDATERAQAALSSRAIQ
jgi:hypothetical protein